MSCYNTMSCMPVDLLCISLTTCNAGNVEIEVPVVTRHVLDYGLKTAENSAMVTAECTFTGIDDANLGISLVANVPIYFIGKPGNGL